ncbi:hypothetical protein HGRIS_014255 [Hohenbuehelia grisea]|uniref:Six-hairpin glycosidase-like protein n=1 Tax=Hohenbuehelia grisea TaxID=104357 RepID=A0ABR3JSU0_9AGAR
MSLIPFIVVLLFFVGIIEGSIDRRSIVARYNPVRNASSTTTPMQVGNGNFAFGADVTGLQTFQPFAIMSSWGWKNDSLPPGKTLADINNYRGTTWSNHGRPVTYDFGGNDPVVEQWLISNPNRVNLGRVGLMFRGDGGETLDVDEGDLNDIHQELDLWTGTLHSQFVWHNSSVAITTVAAQTSDAVSISIKSPLLASGKLGIFVDFPWNDGKAKFSAPFVGNWNATANHTTSLSTFPRGSSLKAQISHTMDASTFITSFGGNQFIMTRDSILAHRYSILPNAAQSSSFGLSIAFSPRKETSVPSPAKIQSTSSQVWSKYWSNGGFVDIVSGSTDSRAEELQRRIVLSRYLMRVNEAGDTPPQESGLVNDGWYGKFHMEMYFWHSAHWALWNDWDLLRRSSSVYSWFLPDSTRRAQVQQHFDAGARWPKMTDPSGRSAPGEINNLLIWQQVHPLVFAEYERRAFPAVQTLVKWEDVVRETADWMADFAWFNESTGVYDLGPPMFVVSEDTAPNATQNPAFELAYWRLGFDIASGWMRKLGKDVPSAWSTVQARLAPLPIDNETYAVYEGIESSFWTDPAFTNDHPSLVGLHGWLPKTSGVEVAIAKATADKVFTHWNISNCWGWDFPMLAMSAARNGETEMAVDWLLHPLFQFDDVGMPIGGVRVPTPYFPGSGSLLYAVAMMARGWDGSDGAAPGFPKGGWNVRAEGLSIAL